jgi:hypothetical protein
MESRPPAVRAGRAAKFHRRTVADLAAAVQADGIIRPAKERDGQHNR